MDLNELSKYELKEIVRPGDDSYDDIIMYLLGIINNRTIPERNKILVRKQFDEIVRQKSILMNPPIFVLTPKDRGKEKNE
ncbi:hypothetical protein [Paenibacillus chitinolyticus]|uniref:hypothetical protein n=1 Tax=Paenibacillus chitinolyticus TaxID=79263 RepID=UPI00366F820A